MNLYSKPCNIIFGFHGCDESVAEKIVTGEAKLTKSNNDYDWLGHGIYFWQNDPERALNYAKIAMRRENSTIKRPAVIGAAIDLGNCLDLINHACLNELKMAYFFLKFSAEQNRLPLSENTPQFKRLDCGVFEMLHRLKDIAKESDEIKDIFDFRSYDSVRGVFSEGSELYPGASFSDNDHVQICVRNYNCIKGVFRPQKMDDKYQNP